MQGGPRFPLPIAPYPDRYPPPFIIHSGMQPFPWSPFKCQAIEVQTSFHRAFCQLHNSHGFNCILWYGAFKVLLPMQLHCSLLCENTWFHRRGVNGGSPRWQLCSLLDARRSRLSRLSQGFCFVFALIYIYVYTLRNPMDRIIRSRWKKWSKSAGAVTTRESRTIARTLPWWHGKRGPQLDMR